MKFNERGRDPYNHSPYAKTFESVEFAPSPTFTGLRFTEIHRKPNLSPELRAALDEWETARADFLRQFPVT